MTKDYVIGPHRVYWRSGWIPDEVAGASHIENIFFFKGIYTNFLSRLESRPGMKDNLNYKKFRDFQNREVPGSKPKSFQI